MFGTLVRVAGRALSTLGRGSVTATRAVAKAPLVRDVVKQSAIGAAIYAAGNAITGSGGSSLPALPGGLPALPGMGAPGIVGNRGIFQNDPNIVAALQPFAISKTNLRMSFRSPIKGYVIRYDSNGDPYAIPKSLARAYLGWKPSKKPPLSVGDWQAIQRADRATKKVRKIMTTVARVDKAVSGGKVKIRQGGKKK